MVNNIGEKERNLLTSKFIIESSLGIKENLRTYVNCGNKYQELIALAGMLGLVKLKWTDNTELFGFVSLVCLILIPLSGVFGYMNILIVDLFFPLEFRILILIPTLGIVLGGFYFWTKYYLDKHWTDER